MGESFWSHWSWPFATGILVSIFTILVFKQYLERKKPHQLYWSVGLFFYAIAAFFESYSEFTLSWNPFIYRIYIVLAASLVGFLGLGSLYLIARRKWIPNLFLAYNILIFIIFLVGVFLADLDYSMLKPGITVGGKALGKSLSFPRVMSLFFNIPGTLFLLGAAILSIIRFSKKAEYAYRMWANILIAIGTIVIAWAGSRARLGTTAGLYPAEMVGAAFLFVGFILAGTLKKGARKIRMKLEKSRS